MDTRPDDRLAFLDDGGELGRRIAAFDWSATSLGPIETWPAGLRSVVGMALKAPLPIALLVGPDGVMLYNDGYAAVARQRHPGALGAKVLECWPEVADFNANV